MTPRTFLRFSALSALLAFGITLISGCSTKQNPDWVVVNYWAIWCAPCREEIPELNKLAELNPANISVLGVNFDQPDSDTLRKHSDKMAIQFPNISIEQAQSMGLSKPATLPTTYILYQGQLQHSLQGPQTLASLKNLMIEAAD